MPRLRLTAPTRPSRPGRWIRGERGSRTYDIYLPGGVPRRKRIPAVLLLHGCRQTPEGFAESTRFTAVADRNRFALIVPQQTRLHQPQCCWRWYSPAHQQRGGGEPALLAGIVATVCADRRRWNIDPRRCYVAGISAGGAMALILAATYPDRFAAAGVHSAPAYRSAHGSPGAFAAMVGRTPVPSAAPDSPFAPVIVVQGTADRVVHAANGERIVRQWLDHHASSGAAAPSRVREESGKTADGRLYTRTRWYASRKRVLEYWRIEGLGHAWSGGRPDHRFSDPAGPRAATVMWQFFSPHQLAGR